MDAKHSRALLLGKGASGTSEETLLARLEASHVLISVDPGVEPDASTAEALIDTLRRLPIGLAIDPASMETDLVQRLTERAAAIDPGRPLAWGEGARPARSDWLRHSRGRPLWRPYPSRRQSRNAAGAGGGGSEWARGLYLRCAAGRRGVYAGCDGANGAGDLPKTAPMVPRNA